MPHFATLRIWLALCLVALLPDLAHAFGASQCAGSRFGSDLVCTANDVQITNIVVAGGAASCTGGQPFTVDLDLSVSFASPDRWDIGVFISNDGKDAQLTPASGGSASCSTAILPTTLPFLDLDPGPWAGVRDTCGDGNNTINGNTGTGVLRMSAVTVSCQTKSTNGKLYIPFVISWDNQKSPTGSTCTSVNDPVPNTKSKCNSPTVLQGSVDVIVLPSVSKTDGITSMTPGDLTTYSINIANNTGVALSTANLNAAVFKDPAASNLAVSSVSCSSPGGLATCPIAPALSVANMQSPGGVTIPSMPHGSTVVFTVSAQLTGNPTGVLTNVASVTANGQSNSASDVNAIVYPTLINMKTVSVISDPVNGASNPKFIPGAEALYTLQITNTGLGTVDRDALIITDPIPANTELYVGDLGGAGSGPVNFSGSTPANNLSWTYTSLASTTDDLSFSNNGGVSFAYTPTGTGYDASVTHIRFNPKGKMAASSALGNPSFGLGFKVRVK
jgi:uncharacterized repeat protein (TIGR01451 family)